MRTGICKRLGLETPIFAFSHCRDVVAAVSRAGGMGVLGVSGFTPEQLEIELRWIDEHADGRPYGVDLLMPSTYEDLGVRKLDRDRILPPALVEHVAGRLDEAGILRLPEAERQQLLQAEDERTQVGSREAAALFDTALQHPRVRLVVSALGTPSPELVVKAHARGLLVGALAGKVEHALAHQAAGVDVVIAQGSEAGGHTGSISSMVLWPQIIDAVAPLPVLAAGGIGRGKQMAAALVMGAQGVWCGSIWLGTRESELDPLLKQRLFAARSEDAQQSRALSGKPCRLLTSRYTALWEEPGAPRPLPMPLQFIFNHEPSLRIRRARAADWMSYPVGQIVGDMKAETDCRSVIGDLLAEFASCAETLNRLISHPGDVDSDVGIEAASGRAR